MTRHVLATILSIIFSITSHASENENAFINSLEELVNQDLNYKRQQNTQVLTAAANLPDRYVFSPTVSLESHAYRSGPPGSNDFGGSGTVGLNLFHFGENQARYEAASAENKAQNDLIKSAQWQAESQATNLLFDLIQVRKDLQIKIAMHKLDTDSVAVAAKQYQTGRRSLQDLQKLQIEAANTSAALSDSRLKEKRVQASLMAQLGHSVPLEDWPWETVFLNVKKDALPLSQDDLFQRPDYLAAVKSVEAADQRHKAAKKGFLPSLDVTFNYGFDFVQEGNTVNSTNSSILVPGSQETWLAKVSLTIPIWDQGMILSRTQTTFANKQKAELEKENIERTAKEQYSSFQILFEDSVTSLKERLKTFEAAKKLFLSSEQRFQNGMMSVNDLILDQKQFYDTQLLLVQGWFDVHTNFVNLCHAKNLGLADCMSILK